MAWFLRGSDDDDPSGSASGNEISKQFGERVSVGFLATSEIEGEFVDDDEMEAEGA